MWGNASHLTRFATLPSIVDRVSYAHTYNKNTHALVCLEIMGTATDMHTSVDTYPIHKHALVYLERMGKVVKTVFHYVVALLLHLFKRVHHVLEGTLQPLDCPLPNSSTLVKVVEGCQLLDVPEQ